MTRLLRSVITMLALSLSLALLPYLGLPHGPLEVTASQPHWLETPPSAPTATATSTSTPMWTPTPTATPTATTPPGDLTLTGLVYDAAAGPTYGVSGATVSVLTCYPRRFQELSGPGGRYTLLMPAQYINQCSEVNLEVWAAGYETLSQTLLVADLRAQPERDFALTPLARTPTPTATAVPGPVVDADIRGFAFVPQAITVTVGTTVRWTNYDSAPHTVTSRTGLFDSGTLQRHNTFERRFDVPGTYDYYCTIHPSMTGTVNVMFVIRLPLITKGIGRPVGAP